MPGGQKATSWLRSFGDFRTFSNFVFIDCHSWLPFTFTRAFTFLLLKERIRVNNACIYTCFCTSAFNCAGAGPRDESKSLVRELVSIRNGVRHIRLHLDEGAKIGALSELNAVFDRYFMNTVSSKIVQTNSIHTK